MKIAHAKLVKGIFGKGLLIGAIGLILFGPLTAAADPLSSSEQKAVNEYPNWVADNCSTGTDDGTTTTVTAGSGAPDGAEFPNLDPTAMANSINAFIKKENANSKMKGLGETIVADGKNSNVNPFLIVAIAREESSMSDPGDYNVSHGSNSFGRMAASGQPSFSGAGPNAGTSWYKWSSVQASVDYTASENQGVSGGGDIGSYLKNEYGDSIASSDLVSLFLKYAPPSGNDTASYIANVKAWVNDMVQGAQGGDAGAPTTGPVYTPDSTTDTDTSSGSSSGCCSSSGSGGTTSISGETTDPPKAVQQVVWNTLTGGGLDATHAAAVMGNIANEGAWDPENSSENPSAPPRSEDPTVTGSGYGYGLIGWTPGQSLLDEMKEAGITGKPYTAETQAAVILANIQGKTPSFYPKSLGQQFLNTKTLIAATDFYEGPGGFENPKYPEESRQARRDSAQQFLSEFGGTTGTAPVSGGGSSTTCCDTGTGSSAPGATASGGDNETTVWNYLVGTMKLSAIQAAGIMGNMTQESGFSPTATNPSSGAYGIAQWFGSRETGLESFASSKGKDKSDINVQLQYLEKELESSYKSSVLEPIKKATSLEDVVSIWLKYYEVPCLPSDTACINDEMHNRMPFAHDVLQKYGDGTVDTGTASTGCSDGSGGSGTAGANGWDLNGPNAMVYYAQCDPKWADHPYGAGKDSICHSGCGITSSAMVVATLADKNQTPLTLADKYGGTYHTNGTSYGLYPVLAHDFGLKEKEIGLDFSQAAATVKAGGLVILSVNPGHFTSEGHVMVIRAVTDDGKFLLADPYNKENKAMGRGDTNNTPYTADYLKGAGAAADMFAFTK